MNYKKVIFILLTVLFVWFFYSGIFFVGKPNKRSVNFNYFKFLSYSVLNGRFDIDCPPGTGCHDLVEYKGRYYLYWPWAPVLVYMPIVAISGTDIYDILITSIFGALNVFFITLFIRRFSENFDLKIKETEIILLGLFWGLGTVHFYMSMAGSVWFIAQIMAQTFLLLSIIIILYFPSIKGFFFSGLFYSMAVYTKNDLLFSIFFLLAIGLVLHKNKKEIIPKAISFFIPFIIFSIINFVYNYIRFENIFENGLKYHKMHGYFRENYVNYGYFSIFYIPYNFFTEVLLPPPLKNSYPFFVYNPEGFGFLWNSPLFFLTIPVFFIMFKKIFERKNNFYLKNNDMILLFGAFLSLLLVSLVIFSIMGTGWVQYASRYSMDYQIFIFVFLLYAFKIYKSNIWFYPVVVLLFLISFYMNYNGVHYFFSGNG